MNSFFSKILFFSILYVSSLFSQNRAEDCTCRFSYAKWLFLNGDYERCINELKNITQFKTECSGDSITYLFSKCYEKIGDYPKSNLWLEKLIQPNSSLKAQALIQTYRNKFLMNDYNYFIKTNYNELDLNQKNQFYRYKVSTKLFKTDTTGILDDIKQVKDTLISNYLSTKLIELGKLEYKSPTFAGLLSSIIPGLGKIYTEQYTDGITSLLLTGLFAFLSYDNFKNNHNFRGWAFGGTSLFFYLGNIYGSILSAKLFNFNRAQDYRKDIYDGVLISDFIVESVKPTEANGCISHINDSVLTETTYDFALNQYENKNYDAAITELKYILFIDQEFKFSFKANKLLGECYTRLKSYTSAENFFLGALRHSKNLREVIDVKFELLKVYLADGNVKKAESIINELKNRKDMNIFCDEINYWAGWTDLYKERYLEAKEKFDSISDTNLIIFSKQLSSICDSILAEQKSVFRAVLLSSIIPGAGQLYAEEFLSGLISFGWNVLWVYLTLDAITTERYFDASIIGSLLWYRFYSGNIQNAQKSIENFNTKVSKKWLNYLKINFKGPKP